MPSCGRQSPSPTADVTAAGAVVSSGLRQLEDVSRLVGRLVAAWSDSPAVRQQRGSHRIGYEQMLVLTPLDDETERPIAASKLVWGRDLSLEGVSFVHESPLPFRKVALTFALPDGDVESLAVRLSWCRFARPGCYQSGGKFLRTVTSPIGGDVDWTLLPRA